MMFTPFSPCRRRAAGLLFGAALAACAESGAETQATQASPAGGTLPDLVVLGGHLSPEPGVPGEPMDTLFVVRNQGTAASGPALVRACEDVAPTFCTNAASVPPLAPGAIAKVRAPIPGNRTAGRGAVRIRTFIAQVDTAKTVTELDEGNNTTALAPAFLVNPALPPPVLAQEEDERATVVNGVIVDFSRVSYGPNGAPSFPRTGPYNKPFRGPEPSVPVVEPEVFTEAGAVGPGGQISVLIHVAHGEGTMPRLPDLDPTLPRFSAQNGEILARRMAGVEAVRRQRRSQTAPLIASVTELGGMVGRFFAIGWSFEARIPVSALSALSQDSRIRSIESIEVEAPPPNHDEVDNARAIVGTDEYFDNGSDGSGWTIGLIDTGVRPTHDLLSSPDRIGLYRDCVHGDQYCNDRGDGDFAPEDDCNHGTSSASIMVGNSNLGDEYRGVTAGTVDSYMVYRNCGSRKLAILDAFDRAISWGNKVIAAEVQMPGGHSSGTADAADDAFDSGSLVIAANGNYGPTDGTVRSPAIAHKALGIGNYDVDTLASISSQSDGPAGDGRVKPDVRFPTNTETGAGTGDSDLQVFSGTSGATPYGASTALILVDESLSMGWSTDPGRIYSMMIAFGDNQDPFGNDVGAGDVFVGVDADRWVRGTRSITDGDVDTVDIDIDSTDSCIEAAIWWGEGITWHNDIDLFLDDPSGNQERVSNTVDSVFERVRLDNPNTDVGTWRLRIEGYQVRSAASPETVYYFARVCD